MYQHEVRAVGVEKNGAQKFFFEELQEECNRSGLYPPFKELKNMVKNSRGGMNSKEDRVTYTLQPRMEAGKIFMRNGQRDLEEEFTLFPEISHDDTIDALSMAVALIEPFMSYGEKLHNWSFADEPELVSQGVTGYGDNY
jgi:predicted phage terminase large subunit-like protein